MLARLRYSLDLLPLVLKILLHEPGSLESLFVQETFHVSLTIEVEEGRLLGLPFLVPISTPICLLLAGLNALLLFHGGSSGPGVCSGLERHLVHDELRERSFGG